MRVRPFQVEDVAWVAPLADNLFADWYIGYGSQVAEWALDPNVAGWVAESTDGPVGFVIAASIGLVGGERPHILDVLAIAVRPEARRLGVARTLLSRVLQQARTDSGVREVRLTVAEGNGAARALFAQAGFRIDRDDDGTFPNGERALRLTWDPKRRGRPN